MNLTKQKIAARQEKEQRLVKRIMELAYKVQNALWMGVGAVLAGGVWGMSSISIFVGIPAVIALAIFLVIISELQEPVQDWFEANGYAEGLADGRKEAQGEPE